MQDFINGKRKKESGFTIIEVVLVLAIAGLIFLIVFLALPQLQRSRRDTQRRGDAGKVLSALESYASNTNGNYPTAPADQTNFATQYINGKIRNPDNVDYAPTWTGTFPTTTNAMVIRVGQICSGSTFGTGTARSVAVAVKLEEGVYCQDNQ